MNQKGTNWSYIYVFFLGKITNSLITASASTDTQEEDLCNSIQKSEKKTLLRSPSGASVQSVLSLDLTGEPFFRLCEYCYKLLDMRQKLKEVRTQKPIICQFYEKMRASIDEINAQFPIYIKMFKSLRLDIALIVTVARQLFENINLTHI